MKPRSGVEQMFIGYAEELPPPREAVAKWAYGHCFKPIAYYWQHRGHNQEIWCQCCGHREPCDGCGKSYYDDFNGFVAWSDKITAQNAATENGWHEIDGRHYCPDCVEYDEELDDWVPKKRAENKEEQL